MARWLVYDLLPLLHPHYYPPGIEEMQRTSADFDRHGRRRPRLHLRARSARPSSLDWLDKFSARARDSPHVERVSSRRRYQSASMPAIRRPSATGRRCTALLAESGSGQSTAVMVVDTGLHKDDSRKGHRQVIAAFEALWREGRQISISVIIGKKGWMVDDLRGDAARASRAWTPPSPGLSMPATRCSRSALRRAPVSSSLAASLGEGFGLPLAEAAQRAADRARDLPGSFERSPVSHRAAVSRARRRSVANNT